MQSKSLKLNATKGMIWNSIENFSVQIGQFAINIILARVLLPADFGVIGMLAIFLALSQTFIDSGMGTALVQKKDRQDIDFSTVFVYNFLVSSGVYLILFFGAPLIASFYAMPQLLNLTRVLCLIIVINSFTLVQTSKLTINLDFRTMAKVNVVAVIVSGLCAIGLAYFGLGVWALVFQNIIRACTTVIMLWYLTRWKPSIKFSKSSFRELFGFGSKLLGASIIATFFNNLYKVLIGRVYSAKSLGFYSQAFQFADMSSGTITSILQKVTFPILTSIQHDEARMVSVYRRIIGMTSFIVFPAMTLFALLADPFIRFFLTDKWLETIPLLQWLCFARIVYPISALNMNILNAKGRSDLFLRVDFAKLPITLVTLYVTIPMGIKAVVIGHVVTSFVSFFINAYMPGKLFSYGAIAQFKDMFDKILGTIFMAIVVYFSIYFFTTPIIKLIIGGSVGIISYGCFVALFKVDEVREVQLLLSSLNQREVKAGKDDSGTLLN